MIKEDLVSRAAQILNARRVRKMVPAVKQKLYIRDDSGNESQFVVKHEPRGYLLNEADVSAVLDALLETLLEFIQNGEELKLYGIGTLGVKYMPPRTINFVDGSGLNTVDGSWRPRFMPGKRLCMAARTYGMKLEEDGVKVPPEAEDEDDAD